MKALQPPLELYVLSQMLGSRFQIHPTSFPTIFNRELMVNPHVRKELMLLIRHASTELENRVKAVNHCSFPRCA